MFYFHTLDRDVELHPRHFGRQMKRFIEEQVFREVSVQSGRVYRAELQTCFLVPNQSRIHQAVQGLGTDALTGACGVLQVEGSCSGKYGYIVAVMDLKHVSQGTIREGSGYATFHVKFQALLYRPFRNEVLQATVDVVNKVHSRSQIPACVRVCLVQGSAPAALSLLI